MNMALRHLKTRHWNLKRRRDIKRGKTIFEEIMSKTYQIYYKILTNVTNEKLTNEIN